jgi:hypothetical protein
MLGWLFSPYALNWSKKGEQVNTAGLPNLPQYDTASASKLVIWEEALRQNL